MNKAQHIITLTEKFSTSFKTTRVPYVEVFENPTPQEFRIFKYGFRFIADNKTKKVYIFDPDVLHYQVREHLGISQGLIARVPGVLAGTGKVQGNRAVMKTSDELDYLGLSDFSMHINKIDWGWAEKYVSGINSYLRNLFV
jgi:hypothetical protein